MLLSGEHDWSPEAETLLHFAARAEHVEKTIRPALLRGDIVISDRFYDSTMAYQGYGQGADKARITALTALIGLVPDRTFMLLVPEYEARQRLAMRRLAPDRYDRLGTAFHARVAEGFMAIAKAEPKRCQLVFTVRPVDDTQAILRQSILASGCA